MTEHCAMIFDLKKSKSLVNRSEVQKILIDSIRAYNENFKDTLVAPFLIILGDEWQGLLTSAKNYSTTIEFFENRLNLPFYVGIGIGECIVLDQELTVNQLDGPAFHKARHAMKLAKKYGYTEVVIH